MPLYRATYWIATHHLQKTKAYLVPHGSRSAGTPYRSLEFEAESVAAAREGIGRLILPDDPRPVGQVSYLEEVPPPEVAEREESRRLLIRELADQIGGILAVADGPLDLPEIDLEMRVLRRGLGLPWKNLGTFDFRDAIGKLTDGGIARYRPDGGIELRGRKSESGESES